MWEFSIKKLHEKSGSEREFKKFKSDLKAIVLQNDVPGYALEWIERDKKAFVSFQNRTKAALKSLQNESPEREN